MERNELCWCGSGKKYKKCHLMIEEKIAYHADKGEIVPTRDMLKTIPQIEGIQKSADLNTAVLDHVAAHIHAGMSTAEIDKLVYDYTNTVESRHRLIIRDSQRVCVLLLTTRSAMVFRMKILFWKKAISSMWMYLPFWTDISQMHPVCL